METNLKVRKPYLVQKGIQVYWNDAGHSEGLPRLCIPERKLGHECDLSCPFCHEGRSFIDTYPIQRELKSQPDSAAEAISRKSLEASIEPKPAAASMS